MKIRIPVYIKTICPECKKREKYVGYFSLGEYIKNFFPVIVKWALRPPAPLTCLKHRAKVITYKWGRREA